MTELATRGAIEAVWRIESARLLGGLVRMVRDVGLAEDLAQEALITALERWPETGIPDNPGAWLMATAKNRAVDQLRRKQMLDRAHGEIASDAGARPAVRPDLETAIDEDVGDDLLRLILVACHPVLSTDARAALTLRLLGGLTTEEIARAFLVPEPTIAQRIVRAKRTLAEAMVPFEVPRGEDLSARLPSVLEVVYLVFNEGYAATRGDDWIRFELCEDALRLLGGLTTEEIARAFLVPEPTIAQRIVRAKRTLAEAMVPFEVPRGEDLSARLPSVLEVIYLIFNEGYAATRGDDWIRFGLCDDALRLGRILAQLVPGEAEVHGLVALMEVQASRLRARVGPDGEAIRLLDQDRSRWDQLLVRRGLAALDRAESLARPLGPYTIQAAIAACHARARNADETDWKRIVALYDALVEITHSPVVELNRAVAVSMAFGPGEALELVDKLLEEPALSSYHLLPAVRGDLLERLGRRDEARAEFERAAFMAQNSRERALLLDRARACGRPPDLKS